MKARPLGVMVFLVCLFATNVHVFAQGKPKTTGDKQSTDKYREARDLIKRARTLLGDYVAENPKGEDAHFARLQLAALENIFKTDAPVAPVTVDEPIVWRVVRVENRDGDTKITLEIENPDDKREHRFAHFNASPLVIVANKKVYAMKKGAVKVPAGAQVEFDYWKLQPTQAITVDLYFDALDEGVLDGIVKYSATNRHETPARFSLMNTNQSSPDE